MAIRQYSVMIEFCDQYTTIPWQTPIDSSVADAIVQQLKRSCCNDVIIWSVTLTPDPLNGRTMLQFYVRTTYQVEYLYPRFVEATNVSMPVTVDGYPPYYLRTADCPGNHVFIWASNWPCPKTPCQRPRVCALSSPEHWYCSCNGTLTGPNCDQRVANTIDLLPLIVIPIVLGLLLLLLLLVCCAVCCRVQPAAAATVVEEVVEEEVPAEIEERRVVRREIQETDVDDRRNEHVFQLPEQTYYHVIGRSFPVVFNDKSYARGGGGGGDRIYGSVTRRARASYGAYNADGAQMTAQSELGGLRMDRPAAAQNYYNSLGRRRPMAFNGQTFTSGPTGRSARSVLQSQPF